MKKNTGKYFEEVVELIEKSLDSDATVKRDVQMTILNSPSERTTQCDIVITRGKHPRITTTIVEVQDRNNKVKPNEFRGWVHKLNNINAQHLICVSRQDFPDSIKEEASLLGDKISLINLTTLEVDKIPLDFIKCEFELSEYNLINWHINKIQIDENCKQKRQIKKQLSNSVNSKTEIFSFNKKDRISFHSISQNNIEEKGTLMPKISTFNYPLNKNPNLNIFIKNKWIPIGLFVDFTYFLKLTNIPTSLLSYEQNNYGVLAWVVHSKYDLEGSIIELRIPIIPNGDNFDIRNMEMSSSDNKPMSMKIKISNNK